MSFHILSEVHGHLNALSEANRTDSNAGVPASGRTG